jgi:hypothetical protein
MRTLKVTAASEQNRARPCGLTRAIYSLKGHPLRTGSRAKKASRAKLIGCPFPLNDGGDYILSMPI